MTATNTLNPMKRANMSSPAAPHPFHWMAVVMFIVLWLTVSYVIWLARDFGVGLLSNDAKYPIQHAMVDFIQFVIKVIVDLLRVIPWPHV